MKKLAILILCTLFLSACGPIESYFAEKTALAQTATAASWTATPTPTNTATATLTNTATPTPTNTATITPTFTNTPTATITPSLTITSLNAPDLNPGDTGTVRGRYLNSSWLHVKFDKLNYWCWVSPSVINVEGNLETVRYIIPDIQSIGSNQYGPPTGLNAYRNGDQVTISWNQMIMTEDKDRGYFIEAWVCQDGLYKWWTVSFPNQFTTSYTVRDEAGCPYPSSGEIYTVEKHGYSQPLTIPWPPPDQK